MTDVSPAKSLLESNIASTPEEMGILLGETLNDERKLELIAKLKKFQCLYIHIYIHTYIHTYIHLFVCLGGSEKAT